MKDLFAPKRLPNQMLAKGRQMFAVTSLALKKRIPFHDMRGDDMNHMRFEPEADSLWAARLVNE